MRKTPEKRFYFLLAMRFFLFLFFLCVFPLTISLLAHSLVFKKSHSNMYKKLWPAFIYGVILSQDYYEFPHMNNLEKAG